LRICTNSATTRMRFARRFPTPTLPDVSSGN
jgi:hypothetical protein